MRKPKSKSIKLLDRTESALAIILAPITLAIILSWNTTPSQTFYPLKEALGKIFSLFLSH